MPSIPDLARSRVRRGGGGDQLGADGRRQSGAALADQIGVPGPEEPGEPAPAVGFTPEHWHYVFVFANTLDEQESQALYERYHIPASGHVFWGSALANIHPGKDDTYVDYHNDSRPPLLFIVGKQDHLFPPKVGHSNAKHYKSRSITEVVEFDGPHLLPAIPGWEAVADFALDWAVKHSTSAPASTT